MSYFVGTEEDFTRFVMPYVRNAVNALTRPEKKKLDNICQHCGKKFSSLDAAHKRGHERPVIVHKVLQQYKEGEIYKVDLAQFEEDLKQAHLPLSEHMLFLCKDCHRKYDNENPLQKAADVFAVNQPIYQSDIQAKQIKTDIEKNVDGVLDFLPGESNRDYVMRIFKKLFESGNLTQYELNRLRNEDAESEAYRRYSFGFSRPLFVNSSSDRLEKNTGQYRYYANPICGNFYLCSQWYFDEAHTSYNLDKFQKWALRMLG